MQLLSSFELLIQPIIPTQFDPANFTDPVVVQAYFLEISNVTSSGPKTSKVDLEFITNPVAGKNPLADGSAQGFLDNTRSILLPPLKINNPSSAETSFSLAANETALFLLQPNISVLLKQGQKSNFEVRGYVNINAPSGTKLLLSPQVRGTFFQFDKTGKIVMPQALTDATANVLPPEAMESMSGGQTLTAVKPLPAEQVPTPPLAKIYAQQAYGLPTAKGPLYDF